jgi:hypothetical protein
MIFEESDIVFESISHIEFEEMCFDLLWKLGFHGLVWRQGGSDNGRDIEAKYTLNNPIIGSYDEEWFFECKNHTSGINVDDISSKIAWAESDKPKHLVIITSSYITNSAREWLEKRMVNAFFQVHLIEGKVLKKLLILHQDVLETHFSDKYKKLLKESMRYWVIYNLLPDIYRLYIIRKMIPVNKMSLSEMIFLYYAYSSLSDDVIETFGDENEFFDFDYLLEYIAHHNNTDKDLLVVFPYIKTLTLSYGFNNYAPIIGQLVVGVNNKPVFALYCYATDQKNGVDMEVLLLRESDYEAKVRLIENPSESNREEIVMKLSNYGTLLQ